MSEKMNDLEMIQAKGLFFIADPHFAATPPGQRLPGYYEQVLEKVSLSLDKAREMEMMPYFLGDLFNWPRENPNSLVVELISLLRPHKPFVLVGNHDKYQARLTTDTSIAVLQAAGALRLVDSDGPVFILDVDGHKALVGASPDGTPLPKEFPKDEYGVDTVIWTSHHNIAFPEFEDKPNKLREIKGVDWLVNGHLHRPQPTVKKGGTIWANPGNITRLTFSRRTLAREPRVSFWKPGFTDLEKWTVPHLDFYQVFPDQEFPPEEQEKTGDSRFVQGLERLKWRKTGQGTGLKQFLEQNLDDQEPEYQLIWELYQEVVDD